MNNILVEVKTQYQTDQSVPNSDKYVYAYTIRILNQGDNSAQLISRHWVITDAKNQTQEVEGLGVIGEQPVIQPGTSYSYTSGVVMETPTGIMTGTYTMKSDNGETFDAEIPPFSLVQPSSLH